MRACEIILPTKRLATWLTALLTQYHRAFIPPRFANFDHFVASQAEQLQLTPAGKALLSDFEQELLLASLLKDAGYRHLRLGHEHEINQLFSELCEWNLADQAFGLWHACLAENIYRSEASVDTLGQRVDELRDLYQRFTAALAMLGVETADVRRGEQSRALAAYLADGGPLPRASRLYLVGFTSLSGTHRDLLKALSCRSDVHLWLSEPPELHGGRNPLQMLIDSLGSDVYRPTARRHPPPPPLTIHRAPTVMSEVAAAITLVQQAVQSGLAPSAIALLVTNDQAYGKPLRTLLPGSGLAYNLAIGTPLAGTLPGSWLAALLDALSGDEEIGKVLSLLAHPLTLSRFAATGLLQPTREQVTHEVYGSGVVRGAQALSQARGLSAAVSGLVAWTWGKLGRFADVSHAAVQPLAAWAASLESLVQEFILQTEAEQTDDVGVDLSAREGITSFFAALIATGAKLDARLSKREFVTLIRDKLLSLDVRSVGDPLRGLQILSVAEARYVPFDLVIVIGCTEGDFPRALPKDHLIDNYFKTRIGLPGWHLLEAIEDTTFHLLKARLPELHLFYPATRSGESVVRSRFVETALVAGAAREQTAANDDALLALLHASFAAAYAPARVYTSADRVGGQGIRPEAMELPAFSATSVEQLIQCPYSFLLGQLGVAPLTMPDTEDTRQEGDWLHAVLEAFFTGCTKSQTILPPLDVSVAWEDFAAYALNRLNDLTDKLAPPHAHETPVTLQLRHRSWPAFVAHLQQLFRGQSISAMADGWRELMIGGRGAPASLTLAGHTVAVRGKIDSVDRVGAMHLITDYKRNGTPERRGVVVGTAPQLPFYALALAAQSDLPLAQAVVGYWSILKGTWQPILAGSAVRDEASARGLIGSRDKEPLEDAAARMLSLWGWRYAQHVAGSAAFVPDPGQCGFCDFAGVCRRDDPELTAGIHTHMTLAARLDAARGPSTPPRAGAGKGPGSRPPAPLPAPAAVQDSNLPPAPGGLPPGEVTP